MTSSEIGTGTWKSCVFKLCVCVWFGNIHSAHNKEHNWNTNSLSRGTILNSLRTLCNTLCYGYYVLVNA